MKKRNRVRYAQERLSIETKDFRFKFVDGNDKELVMELLQKKK